MSIPYARQDINADDIAAVIKVLHSDFLTQGPVVPQFEQAVAEHCTSRYALAVNSATSALHLAYLALGLGPGDWLWTTPNTFVATANCALYCGANVDFVDIDSSTYNLCPQALEHKLIQAEREGRLPKIVVPVHFAGQACDMHALSRLSARYGFKIIEDASHALGGKYNGQPIGNCEYSEATIFSFHAIKIITSGEGGMVVTNNAPLAEQINLLRSHGITRNEELMISPSPGEWYYQQLLLGFNYRMTDIQAALGLSQLQRLNTFIVQRHDVAAYYNKQLKNLPLILPYQQPRSYSAYHLYVIQKQAAGNHKSRAEVMRALQQCGIKVNVHYIPVYLQPYYQKLGFTKGLCPLAEHYYNNALSLPMYAALNRDQQDRVINGLKNALS